MGNLGWNTGNQSENPGNQGGNEGNRGGNAGNLGGNAGNKIEIEKTQRKCIKSNFLFLLKLKKKKENKLELEKKRKEIRIGVVFITTAQLHSTKPELRFCAGSNPARGVSDIRDGEDLW